MIVWVVVSEATGVGLGGSGAVVGDEGDCGSSVTAAGGLVALAPPPPPVLLPVLLLAVGVVGAVGAEGVVGAVGAAAGVESGAGELGPTAVDVVTAGLVAAVGVVTAGLVVPADGEVVAFAATAGVATAGDAVEAGGSAIGTAGELDPTGWSARACPTTMSATTIVASISRRFVR